MAVNRDVAMNSWREGGGGWLNFSLLKTHHFYLFLFSERPDVKVKLILLDFYYQTFMLRQMQVLSFFHLQMNHIARSPLHSLTFIL